MSPFKVDFEKMEWQQVRPDVRQKIYCEGSRQIRLVEFETSDGAEHWCEAGHIGYVLKGGLSISFDGRDAIPELKGYARRFSALSHEWRVARPFDARQLQSLLKAFGIVVIRDRAGEFQHNAAIHLLNRQGRLAAIFDYDRPDLITEHLQSLL